MRLGALSITLGATLWRYDLTAAVAIRPAFLFDFAFDIVTESHKEHHRLNTVIRVEAAEGCEGGTVFELLDVVVPFVPFRSLKHGHSGVPVLGFIAIVYMLARKHIHQKEEVVLSRLLRHRQHRAQHLVIRKPRVKHRGSLQLGHCGRFLQITLLNVKVLRSHCGESEGVIYRMHNDQNRKCIADGG